VHFKTFMITQQQRTAAIILAPSNRSTGAPAQPTLPHRQVAPLTSPLVFRQSKPSQAAVAPACVTKGPAALVDDAKAQGTGLCRGELIGQVKQKEVLMPDQVLGLYAEV
jgi:hypothetical protein